jgi:hypothetical protein
MATQTTALQKAHSAAHHLARIQKAVSDFNDKMTGMHKAHCDSMCKAHEAHSNMMKAEHSSHLEKVSALHKAHHADLTKAIGNMHKILGVEQIGGEYGVDEPNADPGVGGATTNIQDFGGSRVQTSKVAGATEPVDIEAAIAKALDQFAGALVKSLGVEEPAQQQSTVPGGSAVQSFVNGQVAKAAGVGDRSNLAPLPINVQSVTKVQDSSNQPAVVASTEPVTTKTVEKAFNGDTSSMLALMKGATPAPIPEVLLSSGALSKIH